MDLHEYAKLFPVATNEELREMADDIKQRGLINPIVLLEGKILDGRNRFMACNLANVEPEFTEYTGNDPLHDVVSWNLHRRHLSTSQKAALAAEIEPMFAEAAKARMVATLKQNTVLANLPKREDDTIHAREQAAAAVGVSGRGVGDAKAVKRESPELFERVKAGEITVHAAKQEIKSTKEDVRTDPLDTNKRVTEKEVEPDHDSSVLYHMKRYWRMATKKDKKEFRRWIDENND
jgi:hypothetical protein